MKPKSKQAIGRFNPFNDPMHQLCFRVRFDFDRQIAGENRGKVTHLYIALFQQFRDHNLNRQMRSCYLKERTVELNQKTWALRYGIFDVPRVSNGFGKDGHFLKAWQQMIELEERYSILDHPGKIRFLGWLESAHMGSYRETLADPS